MARSSGSIHIADNSVTSINDAIQQLLFKIDELSGEHDTVNVTIASHTHTDTHGGGIDHDDLSNVTINQHHDQDHASRHVSGGADSIKLDDLASPDDNTDLNSSSVRHGLLPKLSGNAADVLHGDGSFGANTSSEATDVANVEGSIQEQPWENIIAGTNITITELASGNAIKIDAAGTPSLNVWNPDNPPSSAGADDDEFGDGSGGVPTGWTEIDHGASVTIGEDDAGLSITATDPGVNPEIAGVYKTIPAGDFTIWCKASGTGFENTNQIHYGLALFEDATNSAGDIITFGTFQNTTANRPVVFSWTAYNVFSTALADPNVTKTGTGCYLRIRRNGTTYTFEFSTDGIGWTRTYTNTISFTPTHYGLHSYNDTGTTQIFRFGFFRYIASDVGITGLMSGRRN